MYFVGFVFGFFLITSSFLLLFCFLVLFLLPPTQAAREPDSVAPCVAANRVFYFAIPPSIYAEVSQAITPAAMSTTGIGFLLLVLSGSFN
jgi:hypothetical protein